MTISDPIFSTEFKGNFTKVQLPQYQMQNHKFKT